MAGMDSSIVLLQSKNGMKEKFIPREKEVYEKPGNVYRHPSYISKKATTLFYFDPNTINAEEWKKLGLRDKTIATIMNYRNRGGRFKEPADIKKIWGLFPGEAERLLPYVRIEAAAGIHPGKIIERSEVNKYQQAKRPSPININHSDTAAWSSLPGIGSRLSQRIVSFRDKLGGFYAVEQVGETFGLSDTTFQKIKPLLQVSGDIIKININTATLEEMKFHPYIKYALANAIVQYRVQHGNYKSITDIKKIMMVTEEIYRKVSPYLATE